MTHLADSNVWMSILRGRNLRLADRVRRAVLKESLATSGVVLAELEAGAERIKDTQVERAALDLLLRGVVSIPFDAPAARVFGRMSGPLIDAGKPVAAVDLLIAATAVSRGLILVTHDQALKRIPNLRVEDWQAEEA